MVYKHLPQLFTQGLAQREQAETPISSLSSLEGVCLSTLQVAAWRFS